DELGCPGLTVAVSIDGQVVWAEGLGYADIEKRTPCSADTVMRIASISKPITMTAAARLMQAGKLDIDKPVKEYIDAWPQQTYKGQNVDITTRQLVSHMSGIRHYEKDCGKKAKKAKKEGDEDEMNSQKELQMKEYYIKEKFTSVASSLNLFKNDELCSLPGTEYLYTTHGWTAVSAVIEGAAKKPFADLILQMFKDLGLSNTYLDDNGPLIYNRSSYYVKNKKSQIENAPYVDNSYKYAGGGFVSTASDLCRFANVMLFSYQQSPTASTPGYLASDTVKQLWSPVDNTSCSWNPDGGYGMGWVVIPQKKEFECGREQRFSVSHTGAAIGASSALFILPSSDKQGLASAPSGVAVAMICNLQDAGLQKTAEKIAHLFDKV
ncbi:hypothetical protein CAPTEDRAFT_89169, partial [Capitella teleta]|uniref:Beta-lactamase-related domain-containing protein n=1 Tax=Capitella teleta TaxID=283909 RepID=X2BAQ6_CAPTE